MGSPIDADTKADRISGVEAQMESFAKILVSN